MVEMFRFEFLSVENCVGDEGGKGEFSMDALNATIISSNFWPPIQVCFFAKWFLAHVKAKR